MHPSSASAVRLLAAWQQQRRALTDRVDTLLLHGPTAVDRVAARAEELRAALEAERSAFEAFVAGAARRDLDATAPGADRSRPGPTSPSPLQTERETDRPDGGSPCIDLVRPGLVTAGLARTGAEHGLDHPHVLLSDDGAGDVAEPIAYPPLRAVTDAGL